MTGGAGFIGSHLARRLVYEGHDVRVLDNFATGLRSNVVALQGEVELIEGDVQSYERVHNAVRGCELVFHQAALPSVPRSVQDPLTSNATNVIGTLNVLLVARDERVRRVVFASSSSVYGANPTLPKREDLALAPVSPYAVAKLACEGYCRSFGVVYGLETVSLRYFNIFGPRQDPRSQYAAVIPNFTFALLNGERPTIFGDGEQSRDFTYIDNVIEANLLAAEAPAATGQVYNVACGERVTLNQLFGELRDLLGSELQPIYAGPRAGEVRDSMADVTRARRDLGYEPRIKLGEGLRRTIGYYEEEALTARKPNPCP